MAKNGPKSTPFWPLFFENLYFYLKFDHFLLYLKVGVKYQKKVIFHGSPGPKKPVIFIFWNRKKLVKTRVYLGRSACPKIHFFRYQNGTSQYSVRNMAKEPSIPGVNFQVQIVLWKSGSKNGPKKHEKTVDFGKMGHFLKWHFLELKPNTGAKWKKGVKKGVKNPFLSFLAPDPFSPSRNFGRFWG